MLKITAAIATCLAAFIALAQESSVADKASDKSATTTTAAESGKKDKEFKPPPGFQTKKRGDLVLYCRRDTTVGTRFKTEKCYDEAQLREYLLALEQQKMDVDRIRGTCGGGSACAPPDPTATR